MQCLLDLSAMGLEPDNQRAYLIPYGNTCTLIVSYKGLVELMRRAGDVASIHADIVCDNDEFSHNMGVIERHSYDLKTARGEMFAAYCQVTFKDGAKQSAIMSKAEINAIRDRSKSGSNGPWKTDFNEMAKKTVVRRVSKMITLSPEIMQAVENSERSEFGDFRVVTPKADQNATRDALRELTAPSEEETPTKVEIEVIEPEGKQTKERMKQIVTLKDISEAFTSGKKTWWVVFFETDSGSIVEMTTFSSSLHEQIAGLVGSELEITFTKTDKGFALESFELTE